MKATPKGKRREADGLIRDEIKRAGTRARNHLSNIQDIAFKSDKMDIAKIAKLATSEIDNLIEDVDKSVTGMNHAFFSGARSVKVSDLKKLIKHDHDVIEMVTKAINIANSAEHAFASTPDEEVKNLCTTMPTNDYQLSRVSLTLETKSLVASGRRRNR